jgi:hypothetical protein
MIVDKENPALNNETTPEEEELMERSSAPTVLDLRAAFKDLFIDVEAIVEAERDSASTNDRPPQQPN